MSVYEREEGKDVKKIKGLNEDTAKWLAQSDRVEWRRSHHDWSELS